MLDDFNIFFLFCVRLCVRRMLATLLLMLAHLVLSVASTRSAGLKRTYAGHLPQLDVSMEFLIIPSKFKGQFQII